MLRHGLFLLLRYLEGQEDNTHLARWLVMEEARARAVFADLYDDLLSALYGSRPQRLYMLAAWDLLEAGGRKRGFLISGGEVDLERMANILLDEFRGGKLGRITLELPQDLEGEADHGGTP